MKDQYPQCAKFIAINPVNLPTHTLMMRQGVLPLQLKFTYKQTRQSQTYCQIDREDHLKCPMLPAEQKHLLASKNINTNIQMNMDITRSSAAA